MFGVIIITNILFTVFIGIANYRLRRSTLAYLDKCVIKLVSF